MEETKNKARLNQYEPTKVVRELKGTGYMFETETLIETERMYQTTTGFRT